MHEASTQPRLLHSGLFHLLPVRIGEGTLAWMENGSFMFWFAEFFSGRIDVWRSSQSKETLTESLDAKLKFWSAKPSWAFRRKISYNGLLKLFPFASDQLPGFHAQNGSSVYRPNKTMKAAQLNVTEKKNSNRRLDPRLEYGSGILFQSKGDKPIKLPWIIQGGMGTGVSNWQQVR